ncbi:MULTISPECIES: hypothetical protein [Paraburkholderia]|uniref:Uncharacterized protein n=1 Tax=Paraburkholderia madseniana TaxID=2599607 RepID=A0AAP5BPY3_9BURK|nr:MULTISPECIES: hypothetical protein [Paraburkholderia]MCX4151993.1 hypothetical protein [Paraburkholderia madseniana]MCX4175589.1 hypothetical protein [Paraburkholderia madseniana]MDN7154921.1 hypothetical protein [Paraburkholderia sp. WS6]MDQ6413804.1 hypothetical protein [Paraburkholderia madseniana]MDQ6463585.1 hypothetical protein [Paraburkholderia madseniana]
MKIGFKESLPKPVGEETGKRRTVVTFSVLCALGLVALVVVIWFPERCQSVAAIVFLMAGGYGALAVEAYEGTLKIFPRKRSDAAKGD